MKNIADLNLGFNDAENYRRRESKDLFTQVFIRTQALENLCERNVYFLIGEKGTGKTAHSVYLSNSPYYSKSSDIPFTSYLSFIRETEYQKFIELKNRKNLVLSDYTSIWKVLIYLLLCRHVIDSEAKKLAPISNWMKLRHINDAIDEFYMNAFSPELVVAMNFVEDARFAAEVVAKHAKIGGEKGQSVSFSENRYQVNLLYLQNKFEEALRNIKLNKHHTLFIDGIDIRPSTLSYNDYLECVKGLGNAIWSINNDFFPSIRDSKGRLKVVLLVRPDIFDSMGLQNTSNKLRDNAVVLDWITTYSEHRSSNIFHMADKLFSSQQLQALEIGEAWDYYFPYKSRNLMTHEIDDAAFIEFLRLSMYRPRDIISMLAILQENHIEKYGNTNLVFREDDIKDAAFMRKYSNYLLGEVKDQLSFYHTSEDYELFLRFFTYLEGKVYFTYNDYIIAYNSLEEFISNNSVSSPVFFESPDTFLQFLYELNVLSYEEYTDRETFIHWCFRDRTPTNLSPKVKTGENYRIHYGLAKSLNTGRKRLKRRK